MLDMPLAANTSPTPPWAESWESSIQRSTSISAIFERSWMLIAALTESRLCAGAAIFLPRVGRTRSAEYAKSLPQDISLVLGNCDRDRNLPGAGMGVAACKCALPLACRLRRYGKVLWYGCSGRVRTKRCLCRFGVHPPPL